MVVRELLYPFLIECVSHTTDPYWKSIFEDLAYGITPYSTYISRDVIICNHKDREFAYKIQRKTSEVLYEEIFELFKKKLGLLSPTEILSIKNNIINDDIRNDWSLIKKKNIRETLIERYVIDMKNKFNLSIQQAKHLNDIIFVSLTLRVLLSSDIIINQGFIENVNGIHFEQGKILLDYNIYNIPTSSQQLEFIIDEKLMSTYWPKFLNTLRKLNPN